MKRINYYEYFNMRQHIDDALASGKFSFDFNDKRDLLDAFSDDSAEWLDIYRYRLVNRYDNCPMTPSDCEKYRARVFTLVKETDLSVKALHKRTRLTLQQFNYVMDYFPEIRKMYHDKQLRLHGLTYDGFTTIGFANMASHLKKAYKYPITLVQVREAYLNHEPVLGKYITKYGDKHE